MAVENATTDDINALINTSRYQLPCRIGPWYEALAFQGVENNLREYKRCHGQLLPPKTRDMFGKVLEPVTVATAVDEILYAKEYQILAPEIPLITSNSKGLYLSGKINETDIWRSHSFIHGCAVTASPYGIPCKRNTFFFTSAEGKSGSINYGDVLFIQICNSAYHPPMYVQTESSTYDTFGNHIYARLSTYPDAYCNFKVLNRRPRMRKISLGSKVVPNNDVVIQHVPSGRNLAVEVSKWVPTFFGPECIVSCHNFQDQNRVETAENVWRIMGKLEKHLTAPGGGANSLECK